MKIEPMRRSRSSKRFVARGRRPVSLIGALAVLVCIVEVAQAGVSRQADLPVLRIGVTSVPATNPATAGAGAANTPFLTAAYAPLFRMGPTGTISAGLAASWRYLPAPRKSGLANKRFEFTLRHDAKFSDGTPVNAQVVASWLTYWAGAKGFFATFLGTNPTFTAVSQWTVEVKLTVPNAQIPQVLSQTYNIGDVVAPAAVSNTTLLATQTYGAGPYTLDPSLSVTGDHYTFVPNQYYYDKNAIKFSQIQFKVIANASSMLQALQAGQLDVAMGDTTTVAAAKTAGLYVVAAPLSTATLFLDDWKGTVSQPLADQRVRQAINYAIDRKTIARTFLAGYGSPTSELITSDASEPKYMHYYAYDPAKARSLLAAAGYGGGFPLKLVAVDVPPFNSITQAVASNLQAVGIQASLTLAPVASYVSSVQSGTYPAFQLGIGVRPAALQWASYLPNGALNPFHLNDTTVNHLYYAAFKSSDPISVWKQMYGRITDQAYFAPVAQVPSIYYVTKAIKNVKTSAARLASVDVTEWSPA